MSAPLVMVAVNTTVRTLLAPTTATVVLGTHWTVMVATVMVSVHADVVKPSGAAMISRLH